MKSLGFVPASALFLLSLALSQPATAQERGSFASGNYQFIIEEDDAPKSVVFEARSDEKGLATGQITFTDRAKIPDVEDDEDPYVYDAPSELYIKAEVESLHSEKNRAVMTATVRDSSHKSYIGKSVQLVVEDNAGNREIPDRLVWSFCRSWSVAWVPSDAERRFDDGAYLRWWATDAEVKDDAGIPSRDLLADRTSCLTEPLWLYTFPEIRKWEGDIVVLQQ